MYVSVFGVSLAAAGLMLRFWASIGALVICAALLLLSSGLSFQQATLWKSTEALFNHTLTLNQRSYLANYSIGAELSDRGRFDEAIQRFTEALAIKPDYLYAQVALGTAWIQKGQFQNAIEHYLSVLDKNPSFVGKRAALVSSMHNNLGMALHKVDRHEEGTDHFRKAVEIDPQSPNGHLNLGTAELDSGRYLDALTEYEKALALSPSNSAIERQMALARRMIRKQLR
jgi:tetratricopeptide (TPR) repeat protein